MLLSNAVTETALQCICDFISNCKFISAKQTFTNSEKKKNYFFEKTKKATKNTPSKLL